MSDQTTERFASHRAPLSRIEQIGGVAHFEGSDGTMSFGEIGNAGTEGFTLDDGTQLFYEEVHYVVGPS